jgi:endonuclease-3
MGYRIAPEVRQDMDRIATILCRLEAIYGRPVWQPRMRPIEELVHCILSQHTSDVNSFRAFEALRRAYPDWEAVLQAPEEELARVIRSGGLARQKARRIQAVLRRIRDERPDWKLEAILESLSDEEARAYLMRLPGIGPKCAAIVLCFALGRALLPVDTHVFRVSWRLGLIERRLGPDRAHDVLQDLVPRDLISLSCGAHPTRPVPLQGPAAPLSGMSPPGSVRLWARGIRDREGRQGDVIG